MDRLTLLAIGLLFAAVVYETSGKKRMRTTTRDEREAIVSALAVLGWPPRELHAAIAIESGWNAKAFNASTHAAGLNQILPAQLERLGWPGTALEFAELAPLDQLPWMRAWWQSVRGRWRVPGDTYLAMAAPSHVGAPDDRVVYRQGTLAWQANPAWRPASGGDITAGSIRAVLLRRLT